MPKDLSPGILYVSESFGTAAHLCASECGIKVRTPLGPVEWVLQGSDNKPSLRPSINNSQHPCKSHYWITDGEVIWAEQLTNEQTALSRELEDERRRKYYAKTRKRHTALWSWLHQLVARYRNR